MVNSTNVLSGWFIAHPFVMGLAFVWSLVWKGLVLWKAAKKEDKWWFIAFLVINTLGILEIFYYFVFSDRKKEKEN